MLDMFNEEITLLLSIRIQCSPLSPLGTRKAFGNAASSGLAVTELKPKDPKAIKEIVTLFEYVFNVKITLNIEVEGK